MLGHSENVLLDGNNLQILFTCLQRGKQRVTKLFLAVNTEDRHRSGLVPHRLSENCPTVLREDVPFNVVVLINCIVSTENWS